MNRRKKATLGDIVFHVLNDSFLIVLSIACVYPIIHIIFASLSDPTELVTHQGLLLWPLGFTLGGYKAVFSNNDLLRSFVNTLVYVSLGTLVNMLMTILGAYALSRRNLMLKGIFMKIIVFTMFFSGGLIPWYITVRNLGLYNNIWAMILPPALNTWNMIILRTGFEAVPLDLEEAAYIDGASSFRVLMQVILPLSKAVLAVIFMYYLVSNWNSWFNAMVLLKDNARQPLQLKLRTLLIVNDAGMGSSASASAAASAGTGSNYRELIKYCVTVVATLPILCIYPFLQKYFVKGVYVGSLKG